MDFDVTIDRDKYIGGSDIPIIMGISPFKTRYELLCEKSGLKENDFTGNEYTEYGNILEPKIRDYINKRYKTNFKPDCFIKGDIRCHTDGFNGYGVLEIKTTSHIFETAYEHKIYLVQLLFYMQNLGVENGVLAIYERPEDFNTDFDCKRLHVHLINISEYSNLVEQINVNIERFRADLAKLRENPLLSEEDLQPDALIALSTKLIVLEQRLSAYKDIENEYKTVKQKLYEAMCEHDIKKWETLNGTKITRVDGTPETVIKVKEFAADKFAAENPVLYKAYMTEKEKKKTGRSGYVKITVPKE